MPRTLLAISDDLIALEDLLSELGGDVTDEEAEKAIDDWLAALGTERDDKLDSYAALIAEFQYRAAARKDEAKRLQELARIDQANADRMKARLQYTFERMGWQKIETLRHRFSIVKSGGKLPLILKCQPDGLPQAFQIREMVYKANQEAIRHALDEGRTLEFAEYGERGQSLRIK